MSRYRVNKEEEKITFWVKTPNLSVIPAMPEDGEAEEESIVVRAPTWNQVALLHTIASGGGMLPFAPDKELDKLLLRSFLISSSFFEVKRERDESEEEVMVNLDEMLNELHPALIDYIVLCIRQRM
jgi:hypothetical protein